MTADTNHIDGNPDPTKSITLRKPHPCGSDQFTLVQMGPEVVLRCAGCRAIVRVRREKYERAVRKEKSKVQDPKSKGKTGAGN